MQLPWLSIDNLQFPALETALTEPNGLLAVGGDLSVERLTAAYQRGIFPWYEADQPILWWSPDPRCVLFPDQLHVSRSLKKRLASNCYQVTLDRAFTRVVAACAAPRAASEGTWISPEMQQAYVALHHSGIAHSVEVWSDASLVGGLYGVALGRVFFGESMFSLRSDASKVGLVHLCRRLQDWGYELIDCQVDNPHLQSLGAQLQPRSVFAQALDRYSGDGGQLGPWTL